MCINFNKKAIQITISFLFVKTLSLHILVLEFSYVTCDPFLHNHLEKFISQKIDKIMTTNDFPSKAAFFRIFIMI